MGALIEQGRAPPAAHDRLRAVAVDGDADVPAVARQLVADLHEPPAAGPA